MLTPERENTILKILDEKNSATVPQLSRLFEVSEVTVRKMLNDMDREGLLKRTRGGAVSLSVAVRENPEKEKERMNVAEKKAIARCAYDLIEDFDSIFLDAGSTTLELAHMIRNGNKRNIVVSTNALNIAAALIEAVDIELFLTGGSVRHKIMSCVGSLTEKAISALCLDKAFMGTNSITVKDGITTPNLDEAHTKRQMMNCAKQSILLCDHTKFGETSMARVAKIDSYSVIISDWKLPAEIIGQLRDEGVNLIIAPEI